MFAKSGYKVLSVLGVASVVYVLPKHLDEKAVRLHLAKIGVVLDELTSAESEYLGIFKEGPFKPEAYWY